MIWKNPIFQYPERNLSKYPEFCEFAYIVLAYILSQIPWTCATYPEHYVYGIFIIKIYTHRVLFSRNSFTNLLLCCVIVVSSVVIHLIQMVMVMTRRDCCTTMAFVGRKEVLMAVWMVKTGSSSSVWMTQMMRLRCDGRYKWTLVMMLEGRTASKIHSVFSDDGPSH